MNEPVRVLSDLHLGHKISRIDDVSALQPLIAGAGTVIFNGDTWQELARAFLPRSTQMLQQLLELCCAEGVNAIFLSGNHDPSWQGAGFLELAAGKIVITHGDALLADSSPWKREILLNPQLVAEMWGENPSAHHEIAARLQLARLIARRLSSVEYPTGRRFIQRAWDAIVPPRRALKIIDAWLYQGRYGAEFCERYFPEAEVLVLGHFHLAGSWCSGGRQIINTGSFTSPGPAHWVEWNDGWLSRGCIDESKTLYRKDHALEVWRIG
jgi:predicted phosphodiesterase